MASQKGTTTCTDVVSYILKATAMPTYGTSGGTLLWISLHTADPTASGSQTSYEATYGSYARVSISRSGSGWTVTNGVASNLTAITFPTCTSSSSTVTHIGIGTSDTGAGQLLYVGAINGTTFPVTLNVPPVIGIGQLVVTET